MKKLLLTIVLGFTLINFSQAQDQSIETSVDSLSPDTYRLSFSFPEKPLYSGNLEDEFPFGLSYATRDASSYSIDSVKVSGDSLDVDVYLTLSEQKLYHFSFNDVVYQDSTSIYQPLFFRIDNTKSFETEYNVMISVWEPINKQRNSQGWLSESIAIYVSVFDARVLNQTYLNTFLNEYEQQYPFNISASVARRLLNDSEHLLDVKLVTSEKYNRGLSYSENASLNGTGADSVIFTTNIVFYEDERENFRVDSVHYFISENSSTLQTYSPEQSSDTIEQYIEISTSTEQSPKIPQKTTLSAYPNPFNPSTQIQYTLPEAGSVTISIFNVLGQQVRTLAEGIRSSGNHTVTFNATGLPAGMYVVRLESTGQSGTVFTETKKVMLLK